MKQLYGYIDGEKSRLSKFSYFFINLKSFNLPPLKTTFCSPSFIFFTDREYLHIFSRTHAYSKQQRRTEKKTPLPTPPAYITLPIFLLLWIYHKARGRRQNPEKVTQFSTKPRSSHTSYIISPFSFCHLIHQIPMKTPPI